MLFRYRLRQICCLLFVVLLCANAMAQDTAPQIYAQRRQKLIAKLEEGPVILRNHKLAHRSNDGDYFPYRVNSDFYYLTGIEEVEAIMVLTPAGKFPMVLYMEPQNARSSQWHGDLPGVVGAMEIFGADTAYANDEFERHLKRLLYRQERVYFDFNDTELYTLIQSTLSGLHGHGPGELVDIKPLVHEMRVIKDADEIRLLRRAIDITCEAQLEAMKAIEPNKYEYEIEAIFSYIFEKNGAEAKSFEPIVASGPNASIFHYSGLRRQALSGEMIMMDMGAEYYNYAADVTRVVPVNGRFSEKQKAVYDIVLNMEQAMIDHLQPGNRWYGAINKAMDIAREGCFDLGLTLDKDSPWQFRLYAYPYIGHPIGLDVHDVGDYGSPRDGGRVLAPNMIFAIEPMIYIGENLIEAFRMDIPRQFGIPQEEVDAFLEKIKPVFDEYKGIAARVEDDVLITENGNEVLSAHLPRSTAAIEKVMKEKSDFMR